MRISDWSSDVCSSDLGKCRPHLEQLHLAAAEASLCRLGQSRRPAAAARPRRPRPLPQLGLGRRKAEGPLSYHRTRPARTWRQRLVARRQLRSEEHTSELQSLMRISSDVFCLKKKNIT